MISPQHNLGRFIDPQTQSIDFDGMIEACGGWTSDEQSLVHLAESLWELERPPLTLEQCLDDLIGRNFTTAIEAVR